MDSHVFSSQNFSFGLNIASANATVIANLDYFMNLTVYEKILYAGATEYNYKYYDLFQCSDTVLNMTSSSDYKCINSTF